MKYCSRCLYPSNHPLYITFDDEGVCSGCRVHEEKERLDWEERGKKLGEILKAFRSPSGNNYDCVIPVSGARDSYFIVHTVKKVYGMNPLLVTYNKHYNTKLGFRNLSNLRITFDCDMMSMVVDPAKLKRITRYTLKRFGSMYWHCLAGQTVYPVQVAARCKIPLIIWGAHQGLDQVGMFSHLDEVEMTRKYRKEHDLMGFEAEDLINEAEGVSEFDVLPFVYPHDREIEKVGIRGIYLGNYIPWDSKKQHEQMIEQYGYETGLQQRTFDTYNDIDCFHYSGLHDYIKYLKVGYGKATDHACRELRWGRLTREDAIELVQRYQAIQPKDIRLFLQWLDMSEEEFYGYIDNHRDPRVWEQKNNEWVLKDSVANHRGNPAVALAGTEGCNFVLTGSKDPDARDENYVLLDRGFVG